MRKSSNYYHPQHDFYAKRNIAPPEAVPHGTEEDLEKRFEKLLPHSWRLEGNKLIGETSQGPLINFIPTDYILVGVDEDGLPILEKISQ